MISKVSFYVLYKKFKFLRFAPADKEALASCFGLYSLVLEDDEQLEKAFAVWVNNNDTFPTHIDLKKIAFSSVLSFKREDIFDSDAETTEILNIRAWCYKNFKCEMPKKGSYEYRTITTAEYDEIIKSQDIAIKSYCKAAREGQLNHKAIVSGEVYQIFGSDSKKLEESRES